MTELATKPLYEGSDWNFDTIQRIYDTVEKVIEASEAMRRVSVAACWEHGDTVETHKYDVALAAYRALSVRRNEGK